MTPNVELSGRRRLAGGCPLERRVGQAVQVDTWANVRRLRGKQPCGGAGGQAPRVLLVANRLERCSGRRLHPPNRNGGIGANRMQKATQHVYSPQGPTFEVSRRRRLAGGCRLDRRVCAQHGRELMGCKSPVGVPTWIDHQCMITTSRRQGQDREELSEGSRSARGARRRTETA